MSAAIVAGQLVPQHLRVWANDSLRQDLRDRASLRLLLDDETLRENARLALRIETQITIDSAVRHASPHFAKEFSRAEDLAMSLWATGCSEWLEWTVLEGAS